MKKTLLWLGGIIVAIGLGWVIIGLIVDYQLRQKHRVAAEDVEIDWSATRRMERDMREFRRARREAEREAEIRQMVPLVEVEWQPLISLSPKLHHGVSGIFVDPDGAIRVVDGHPRFMRGGRVWLSRDDGQTWILERWLAYVSRKRAALLGPEAAKVIFASGGGRLYEDWPEETKSLLKTVFQADYERSRRGGSFAFNRDPNYPGRLVFTTSWQPGGGGPAAVWVSLDNGEQWALINAPHSAWANNIYPDIFSVAIRSYENKIVFYVGLMGGGENIVQYAVLPFPKLQELLAER